MEITSWILAFWVAVITVLWWRADRAELAERRALRLEAARQRVADAERRERSRAAYEKLLEERRRERGGQWGGFMVLSEVHPMARTQGFEPGTRVYFTPNNALPYDDCGTVVPPSDALPYDDCGTVVRDEGGGLAVEWDTGDVDDIRPDGWAQTADGWARPIPPKDPS